MAIRAYVDEIVTVSDAAILDAVRLLLFSTTWWWSLRGRRRRRRLGRRGAWRTVAVVSGGNIAQELLRALLQ